jgi:hypothetical protein
MISVGTARLAKTVHRPRVTSDWLSGGLIQRRLTCESTIRDAAFDSDLRNVFDPKG